jgi:hypothetical protein
MGLGDIGGKIGGLLTAPVNLVKKVWDHRLVRVCVILFSALAVIVPVLTIIAVNASQTAKSKAEIPPPRTTKPFEPNDIFLPEEPDFLPQALLPREPSPRWTITDAEPYWTPPSTIDANLWLERIEKTIDTLLENVR